METRSVLLEIPEEILERGEKVAAEQHITLSELVSRLLGDVRIENRLDDPEYKLAMERQLALMKKGFPITNNGVIDWKREDLYDRHGSE